MSEARRGWVTRRSSGEVRSHAAHLPATPLLRLWGVRRLYHRAELQATQRLPDGPAVVVSNHGRLDFDSFILAGLVRRSIGREVRVMADHLWFGLPGARRVMSLMGALEGTRENAAAALEQGGLGPAYSGCRDPLVIGLLPIPLPFSLAVHLPLPCKLRYVVGEPVYASDGTDPAWVAEELAERVALCMRDLIVQNRR